MIGFFDVVHHFRQVCQVTAVENRPEPPLTCGPVSDGNVLLSCRAVESYVEGQLTAKANSHTRP